MRHEHQPHLNQRRPSHVYWSYCLIQHLLEHQPVTALFAQEGSPQLELMPQLSHPTALLHL
jgi:hypothetical protein